MKNKPFYTIGHLEIPQDIILNKPLFYFEGNNKDGINKIFKELKKLTGYQFDNKHLKWSNIYGHHFSISVYCQRPYNEWDISVWDHRGLNSILRLKQPVENKEADVLSDENYKELKEATEKYVRGIINCSDCKEEIKKEDVAGRYFASQFCESCWNRKWKEIESKENYN